MPLWEQYRFEIHVTLGALVGLGLVLLVVGIRGVERPVEGTPTRRRVNLQRSTQDLLLGLAAGLLVLVAIRWVVLAVAIGLLVALRQRIFGGARTERKAISQIEGLAAWTESLRDTIAGAVGLEQAIPATAVNAAPSIRPSLNLLVDRLRVREPLPDALLKFSDDLDDPSADLIVAALILNSRLRGPGLRDVLSALSEAAREELDLRRRVESSRRSTRRSVQIVVGVISLMALGLVLLNREYVEPYGTVEGQAVLAAVLAMFTGSVLWLRSLAGVETPERFLVQSRRYQEAEADVVVKA